MTTMDYNYHLKKALDAGSEATKAHESGDLWSAAEHNKTMLHHLGELRKIKHKIPPPALSALANLTSLGSHLTEVLAGLDARSLNPNVTTEKFTDVTDTASTKMNRTERNLAAIELESSDALEDALERGKEIHHKAMIPHARESAHTEEAALITGRNWNEHAQVTDHKHHMVEAGKHLAAYNKAVAAHKAATKSGHREKANKASDRAQRHLGWNRKHLATARELYHKVAASLEAGSEETSAVSALGQAHTIVHDNTKSDVHGGDDHPNPAKRTSTRYHLSDTDAERAVGDLKKAGFRPHPKPASGVLHHFVKGKAHVKINHPDSRDNHHIISVHS